MEKNQDKPGFRDIAAPLWQPSGVLDDGTRLLVAEASGILESRPGPFLNTLVEFQGGHGLGLLLLSPLFRRGLEVTDNALTLESFFSFSGDGLPLAAGSAILTAFPPDPDFLAGLDASVATANLLFTKGKERFHDLARSAWLSLAPGGLFLAVGHRSHAITPFSGVMEDVFGNAVKVAYGKGCSLFLSSKEAGHATPAPPPAPIPTAVTPAVGPIMGTTAGVTTSNAAPQVAEALTLAASPWVFASGQVDGGTHFLLKHSPSLAPTTVVGRHRSPPAAICDLGCGSGILGMVAASRFPGSRVYLVDSSASAVALAVRNLAANGITNAMAGATAGLAFFSDRSLDLILCNPPFHQEHLTDHTTAQSFIAEARRTLRPGGTLELVANRFLSYERPLRAVFGADAGPIAEDSSFKLLVARIRDR